MEAFERYVINLGRCKSALPGNIYIYSRVITVYNVIKARVIACINLKTLSK